MKQTTKPNNMKTLTILDLTEKNLHSIFKQLTRNEVLEIRNWLDYDTVGDHDEKYAKMSDSKLALWAAKGFSCVDCLCRPSFFNEEFKLDERKLYKKIINLNTN